MRFYLAIVVQGEEDVVVVFPVFKALFYQTLVKYRGYANIICCRTSSRNVRYLKKYGGARVPACMSPSQKQSLNIRL